MPVQYDFPENLNAYTKRRFSVKAFTLHNFSARYLALAYSTYHADMSSAARTGCGDIDSNLFGKQGGITNGAKWYSLQGGKKSFCFDSKLYKSNCLLYRNARLQLFIEQ